MVVEVTFWSVVFLGTAALLFCCVYTLIMFADLTVDHINPIELCAQINQLVLPEYMGHFFVTAMLILRGYLFTAALNFPLIAFHLWRYKERKHLLDNTSIFNDVTREKHICEVKLAVHLVMFFVYLYLFIMRLVAD